MTYNSNDNKKKKFKQSLIVALSGFIILAIVIFGAVANIKKNVKKGIYNSGEYITEAVIKELKTNCITKESVAVEVPPAVATTGAAITTEPAIVYEEVETFTPDLKYFMPNSLSTVIGEAPKDKGKNIS